MKHVHNFSPAWFVRGPHAQTIWGRLARPRRLVELERESVTTPDGDELVLDHLHGSPRIYFVLMHGLEGSSYSVYIQGILSIIAKHGFAATAMNFRSCARDPKNIFRMLPNRRPRFYHSGETEDFDFVVCLLQSRMPQSRFVAFGASLGGNALLKWLGEHPNQAIVTAAATLSVPFDLAAGASHLERGAGPLYVSRFLRTLKKKVAQVVDDFPEARSLIDLRTMMRAKSFREFDDAATAPLHGFKDADDYYTRSSSLQYLSRITTPTLCVNAEDDPFLPHDVLQRARAAASPSVEFVTTPYGGHVGFISGTYPWKCIYWAEELVVDWLVRKASGVTSPQCR